MPKLFAALCLFLIASCHLGPTQAQLDGAEIGPPPTIPAAQGVGRSLIIEHERDPGSSMFQFAGFLTKSYFFVPGNVAGKYEIAWTMGCTVFSKDTYGAYGVPQKWRIFFKDREAIATGVLADYRGLEVVTVLDQPISVNCKP